MDTITLHSRPGESWEDSTDSLSAIDEQVLALITDARHGMSRAELVSATDLPKSTVHVSVRKLIELGDIEEFEMAGSTGGRRAALLRAVPKRDLTYVAELGTKHARIGISDLTGKLLTATDIPTSITDGQESILGQLKEQWEKLHAEHCPTQEVTTAGIAVPGPVDNSGLVTGAARMPGWNRSDIGAALSEYMNMPTVVENDARAGAIGEWSRRGETTDSGLYIKAGSGIGASWISNGSVFRGSLGFAGEITHTRIHTDSPLVCSCGNTGCLETVASGAAILRRLKDTDLDITSVEQLIKAAENGDYPVVPLVREAGLWIGEVLSGLVNFLNPKAIIIGGSLSQIDALIAGIRSELYRRCLPMSTSDLTVETSRAGQDAPLIGLAILARQLLTR